MGASRHSLALADSDGNDECAFAIISWAELKGAHQHSRALLEVHEHSQAFTGTLWPHRRLCCGWASIVTPGSHEHSCVLMRLRRTLVGGYVSAPMNASEHSWALVPLCRRHWVPLTHALVSEYQAAVVLGINYDAQLTSSDAEKYGL